MIRRSAGVLPWIVSVTLTLPIAVWFSSFAAESGKLAAQDAHAAVKTFVKGVFALGATQGAVAARLTSKTRRHG